LHQPLEVELAGEGGAGAVEDFERASFLAQLADARLERLVERQQPGLELLALGDVPVDAGEVSPGAAFVRADSPLPAIQRIPSACRTRNSA